MTAYYLQVQLADSEWGNELMREAAREAFARYEGPEYDLMVVQVGEHAGWFLSFLRDGTCVGTANDRATTHLDNVRTFNARCEGATWEYLPTIWRGRDAQVA